MRFPRRYIKLFTVVATLSFTLCYAFVGFVQHIFPSLLPVAHADTPDDSGTTTGGQGASGGSGDGSC